MRNRKAQEENIRRSRLESLATNEDVQNGEFPSMHSLSAAFVYNALPVPLKPDPPELVYFDSKSRLPMDVRASVHNWNMTWEAAQFRNEVQFEDYKLPPSLEYLREKEKNVYLLPLDRKIRYGAYATLFHMLPAELLSRHGLPLLKRGLWPHRMSLGEELILPRDFNQRLSQAFSEYIWPLLDDSSLPYIYGEASSLKVLSHNLDHWLPYAFQAVEEIARKKPLTEPKESFWEVHAAAREDVKAANAVVRPPLCGGDLWTGPDEAWEVAKRMVELADGGGRLRAAIDAIRSHKVEDDFSDRWSTQKVDFERAFYKSRLKVNFVEISDALPVHGPWSEVHEDRLWSDLAAVVDPKDRRVVVFLRQGFTSISEISERLGYKNHSPVSKALARIRNHALKVLG